MSKFQSLWIGNNLPPYQRLAMKSFVDYGHQYVLYSYRPFDVPAGVALCDANAVLPESRIFFYGERAGIGRGSVAAFANLFRWHLLYRMGDWWVDTDVVCLSETVPPTETFLGWEIDGVVNNAILKFPKHNKLVQELCDFAEKAGSNLAWGDNGCNLLTRLVREHELSALVTPQPEAYPVRSVDALKLLNPAYHDELGELIRNKPYLHLCNEIMRRAVIFPWMAPPPGSLAAGLFERHGIDFGHAPVYAVDEIQRLTDNYVASATWSHTMIKKSELAALDGRLNGAQYRSDIQTDEM